MPKKKGKKDKKRKLWVNERETVTLEQQIVDNNKQLTRLRSRNEELETDAEKAKEALRKLEEDRADVIAHLKRLLQTKAAEASELNSKLVTMEEIRRDEIAAYKKEIEAMQNAHKIMETNLTAEIKLATGKLNSLEDWRLARIDLMRKFEIQEEQMAEQEVRHKKSLYDAERNLILSKAKVQKEMEKHLNELAKSFRDATNIRICDATHRAVKENIALHKKLDVMYTKCLDLEAEHQRLTEVDRSLRMQADLYQAEAKIAFKKVSKKDEIISELCKKQWETSLEIGKIKRVEKCMAAKEGTLEMYRKRQVDTQKKIHVLEQHIEKTKHSKQQIIKEMKENREEIDKLHQVLAEAKNCLTEALHIQADIPDEEICCHCVSDVKEKLLHSLLDILSQYQAPKIMTDTVPKRELIECRYKRGDLGIVPSTEVSSHSSQDDIVRDRSSLTLDEVPRSRSIMANKRTIIEPAISKEESKEEPEMTVVQPKTDVPECLLSDSDSSPIYSPKESQSDN